MARTDTRHWVSRWWLVFFHGILLIWLSYEMISRSDLPVGQLGRMTAFLAMLTGAVAVLGGMMANRPEKSPFDLWWGLVSAGAGLVFLARPVASEDWVLGLLSLFMLLNAFSFFIVSLQLSPQPRLWGYGVFFLVLTLAIAWWSMAGGLMAGSRTWLIIGFQFFLNGFLLVIVAFGLRRIRREYNIRLFELREQANEPHLYV